ncbi:NmrA family protein [Delitschia confertaspora ATCC 74209]|uniref:NmrA family protein n=1 Tax=Delitschia confertaspora ATCC 74209 TaxID=1513339 RepID=A0A9P4JQE5_9PLEO|nr:NmrA family protein [Delitschia confertaspora ATCC 74209]
MAARNDSKAILVTGITGKQGGAVIRGLATHPSPPHFTLLGVTRNPSSSSAKKLVEQYPSIHLVKGDLNDVPALFEEAQRVLKEEGQSPQIWGVYSVQVSIGPGVTFDTEVGQGKALIDEALHHGVQHFIYSSVERGGNEKSWTNPTPIPHFQSKHQIELHLREKAGAKGEKMGWTILRPVAFMDNMAPGFQTKVFLSALRNTLGDKPLQWISVDDIGLFAGKAFRQPQQWNTVALGLAGDELNFDGLNRAFKNALGYPAPVAYGIFGTALMWAVKELNIMITWFKTEGYGADIPRLRSSERNLCNLETWLKERSAFEARK